MAAAVARDPRVGLRPNLDFLEAYQIYEQVIPLTKLDIRASLAIRSPLFKRIEEGLTEQSRAIAEHQSDQATTRRVANESGVPVTSLAQMQYSLTPPDAPPTTLPDADAQVREARRLEMVAERQRLLEGASDTFTRSPKRTRRERISRTAANQWHPTTIDAGPATRDPDYSNSAASSRAANSTQPNHSKRGQSKCRDIRQSVIPTASDRRENDVVRLHDPRQPPNQFHNVSRST